MTLAAPSRLGPYEILAPLGSGGFGEVYKARDTRLDRTVAIKILPSADPELKARFEREAKAIAALQHPLICTLHDVGHQDGTDYLVLEYLEGDTLAHRLEKGALPLDQALKTAIEIADALDRAHRAGIVHRDLKPANVMLTQGGVKLLDFGLAKLRPAGGVVAGLTAAVTQTTPVTGQGSILGTLQYMSPEQLEGQEADARSDLFAFGCVLYEMLAGRPAFAGKSQASVISAILSSEPPSIGRIQPLTPPLLEHVIQRCVVKNPDSRWQTAADLKSELKWIENTPIAPAIAAQRRGGARLPWLVVGLLLVISAALTTVIVFHREQQLGTIRFLLLPPPDTTLGAQHRWTRNRSTGTSFCALARRSTVGLCDGYGCQSTQALGARYGCSVGAAASWNRRRIVSVLVA